MAQVKCFSSQNIFFFFWKTCRKKREGEREIDSLRFLIQAGEDAKVLVHGYLLSDLGGHKEKMTLGNLLEENSVFLINENSLDFRKLSANMKRKYKKIEGQE